MTYQFHELTIDKSLATVAFNHPPLNINDEAVNSERCTVLNRVLDDESIHVIILTSAIPDQFGAGNDLREYLTESKERYRESTQQVLNIVERFISSDKISIAAINGNAIGAAADLTLMCDMRVMGEGYYLRWPEAYLGLMPHWGATTLLPMLVGRSHALEWLLSGREVSTEELSNAGLVHHVVAPDAVMKKAKSIAKKSCAADPNSVRAIKTTLRHSFYMPLDYAFGADVAISAELFRRPENLERARAFLEHRMNDYLAEKENE